MQTWNLDEEFVFLNAVREAEEAGHDLAACSDQELRDRFDQRGHVLSPCQSDAA